ncbi:MAG TPA: hypothetical protein VFP54_07975 [Acidimicrobiales bacterium]|nr:hypothetical protein [Acidimicrobiales bacterium]
MRGEGAEGGRLVTRRVDGGGVWDPRSAYAETFWLGVIGPSTLFMLRCLADALDAARPQDVVWDVDELARQLGLGYRGGRNSPVLRAVHRSVQFRLATFHSGVLCVSATMPTLSPRMLSRLPARLREAHEAWVETAPPAPPDGVHVRARQLAASLLQLGEDRDESERQLLRWGYHPAVAAHAIRWATGRPQPANDSARATSVRTPNAVPPLDR